MAGSAWFGWSVLGVLVRGVAWHGLAGKVRQGWDGVVRRGKVWLARWGVLLRGLVSTAR